MLADLSDFWLYFSIKMMITTPARANGMDKRMLVKEQDQVRKDFTTFASNLIVLFIQALIVPCSSHTYYSLQLSEKLNPR